MPKDKVNASHSSSRFKAPEGNTLHEFQNTVHIHVFLTMYLSLYIYLVSRIIVLVAFFKIKEIHKEIKKTS